MLLPQLFRPSVMLRFPYAVTLLVSAAVGTYVIEDDSFGHGSDEVRMKVLVNRATEERVEIAYTAGGRTEEVVLRSPATGSLRKVLLSSERNATDVKVNNGWKGDMLIPYANRIKNASYTLNGKTYYMERNEDRSPYGKEGLHGYLYKKVMRVVNHKADNESASLTLAYDFDGTDPGYPFFVERSADLYTRQERLDYHHPGQEPRYWWAAFAFLQLLAFLLPC